jgi:Protein of unknown function (DUF1254)
MVIGTHRWGNAIFANLLPGQSHMVGALPLDLTGLLGASPKGSRMSRPATGVLDGSRYPGSGRLLIPGARLAGRSSRADDGRTSGARCRGFRVRVPAGVDLQQVGRFARSGIGDVPATPFNRFGHASQLAGPEATFVSISNDTVYSIARVDLSGGPVRLDVPDTAGRYYVLQFVDAWTNNFAYVGHRATGTSAGSFPPWVTAFPAAGSR